VVRLSVCRAEPGQPPPRGDTADNLLVEKSKRQLTLFANGKVLKVYRISLGKQPTGAKEREGDRKTPEGNYLIDYHKRDSNYHLALHISYPNEDDLERARREGVSPGSAIMIHGIRNGLGWLGELHQAWDWTGGCIAVTNEEMEELWQAVPDGTPIEIRP
ncbi:MAG: L,D-transpeptidase family protein, partial [Geobacteraceae bacterium]|nr:L,D-transpeptidase family protein [Geobacteraceae bacterium]